ncbi:MAG TPA: type II secretion system protein N [Candidatus Hydrogenedentes bacterium]|nr:type II secretion system protein N [Candidatus Hydrogenedentota bacterium]HPG66188.1 type II secretion system protein N [Candidatus Hydrogenedentota bacterium]
MLKGLVIRRVFTLIDFLLVVGVLVAGGAVVRKALEEMPNPYAESPMGLDSSVDVAAVLHNVQSRDQYEGIIRSRIFGPAGDEVHEPEVEAPPPEPAQTDVEETTLNLSLRGTVSTSPKDPLASATIENKDTREIHVHGLGDAIVENVLLEEVYARKVIILNNGKKEVLRMDEEEDTQLASASPAASTVRPTTSSAPDRFSLNKNDFVRQLYVNYADLITKVQPRMERDENGNVLGITATNLEEIPLAETLDLKDGDVLQTINNERIDSEQKIIQLINRYRDSSVFRIGILRDGQPVERTYRLE